MANVRLRLNLIAGGKFYARSSVIDEALIPEHLRDSDHIDRDPEDRQGRVLLLREFEFFDYPKAGFGRSAGLFSNPCRGWSTL